MTHGFGFDSWVGTIPWRRKWQPAPVFLPGKSHGQRRLASCSPWGCRFLMTWYQFKSWNTVSPLYTSLQVLNLQKWECTFACPVTLKYEWNCNSPSASCCWRSFSSPTSLLLSHPHSVTVLACSLAASPCMPSVVRYYCNSQGTLL